MTIDNNDDESHGFIRRITWIQLAVFWLLVAVGVLIRGFTTEVVIGLGLLVLLSVFSLMNAYQVRKARLGAGLLVVAVALVGASFVHDDTWNVAKDLLWELAIGSFAFAIATLAWDSRTGQVSVLVQDLCGLLAALGLVTYAIVALLAGVAAVTGPKGLLTIAALVALAATAGKHWQKKLSIASLPAIVILLIGALQYR